MSDSRHATLPALVVGTGFGCRIQIPALRAAGFEVAGLVGADAGRTAQRASDNDVPGAFTDLEKAIEETGARVVTIATPPHTHAPLTLAAVDRGCHVICEKPFAMNTGEARRMQKAAEGAGVVNLLGHEFRFMPQYATVSRAMADGIIGDPRFITLTDINSYVAAGEFPGWWFDRKAGGGWLGALGPHLIDWVRSVFGEFESLSGALPNMSGTEAMAEDSFIARFRLAGGLEGILQQIGGSRGRPASIFRVDGTRGTVWIDGNSVWFADGTDTRELATPADLTLPPPPVPGTDPRQQSAKWQALVKVELAPYTALCRAFRALIEGEHPPGSIAPATFADGVASMEVIDGIRESAAGNGVLVRL